MGLASSTWGHRAGAGQAGEGGEEATEMTGEGQRGRGADGAAEGRRGGKRERFVQKSNQ